MIVPISRPVTRIGWALINGIPRPAIHATKIPMPTAANILRFIKTVRLGICILPETSGLNTPTVKKIMPTATPYFSAKGRYWDSAVCCISNNTVAEIVIEPLLLKTPSKISKTRNNGITFRCTGYSLIKASYDTRASDSSASCRIAKVISLSGKISRRATAFSTALRASLIA